MILAACVEEPVDGKLAWILTQQMSWVRAGNINTLVYKGLCISKTPWKEKF